MNLAVAIVTHRAQTLNLADSELAALAAAGDVDDDANQPGGHLRFGAKAGERTPGVQVGLLKRVFGVVVVAKDVADLKQADESPECKASKTKH